MTFAGVNSAVRVNPHYLLRPADPSLKNHSSPIVLISCWNGDATIRVTLQLFLSRYFPGADLELLGMHISAGATGGGGSGAEEEGMRVSSCPGGEEHRLSQHQHQLWSSDGIAERDVFLWEHNTSSAAWWMETWWSGSSSSKATQGVILGKVLNLSGPSWLLVKFCRACEASLDSSSSSIVSGTRNKPWVSWRATIHGVTKSWTWLKPPSMHARPSFESSLLSSPLVAEGGGMPRQSGCFCSQVCLSFTFCFPWYLTCGLCVSCSVYLRVDPSPPPPSPARVHQGHPPRFVFSQQEL